MKKNQKKSNYHHDHDNANNIINQNYNKFSNVIGYHQPDLSTNKTVYASCL